MRPQADQFHSAAADACSDSRLFAAMERNGNCFAALHNLRLHKKSGFIGSDLQLGRDGCVVTLLEKRGCICYVRLPIPQIQFLQLLASCFMARSC